MAEWRNVGNGGTAERMEEWSNGRNGYIRTIYGFVCHFTKLDLLFLNHTLLGGVESLRSKSGI
jgi:hypothetical protein